MCVCDREKQRELNKSNDFTRSSEGRMTGLRRLRKKWSFWITTIFQQTHRSFRWLLGRVWGPCFIRHLAKPPRLICISATTAAATKNKAALNFYGPIDNNAAASEGREWRLGRASINVCTCFLRIKQRTYVENVVFLITVIIFVIFSSPMHNVSYLKVCFKFTSRSLFLQT